MIIDYKILFVICANAGLSIKDTYIKAGISKTTIANIKAGKSVKTVTAGKLAKALGCNVEQLLKDE